jgi:hypothetical protein
LIIDANEAAAASGGGLDFDLGDADATQVMKTARTGGAGKARRIPRGLDFDLSRSGGSAARGAGAEPISTDQF